MTKPAIISIHVGSRPSPHNIRPGLGGEVRKGGGGGGESRGGVRQERGQLCDNVGAPCGVVVPQG